VLDLLALGCPSGAHSDRVAGLLVHSDGLHFTPEAVQRLIAPWLLPQLTALATTGTR
jgi:hypothetical protein